MKSSSRLCLSNKITAIDAHACGELGRVITGGVSNETSYLHVMGKLPWRRRSAALMEGLDGSVS